MKKTIQLLSLMLLIVWSSCKGDKGEVGPNGTNGTNGAIGTTGPIGPTGTTGAQGQMGLTGATGNANVKVKVFSALTTNWVLMTSTAVSNYYESTAAVPEITQAIHDRGLVLAYMSEDNTPSVWLGLPALQVIKSTTPYMTTFKYKSKVGSVIFTAQDSDGTTPIFPSTRFFKVVVIEGTGILPPNVDISSYASVAKYLNLDAQ